MHKPDPVGTLPKPCNAGLIDIEWVIEDLTKTEVQQSWWNEVFRIKRFRYKAFGKIPAAVRRLPGKAASVPTGSGLGFFCNVKVNDPIRCLGGLPQAPDWIETDGDPHELS